MKNNIIEEKIHRTLTLAKKAEGRTSPNPMVGAVIIKNGQIVGEGYHKKAGGPHAEIEALKKAGTKSKGASLYVNLEPCCVTGRTGPCTEAIIKSGIKEVFIGMCDPNPRVSGDGIRILKKSGIEITSGILEDECKKLNEIFIKFITTKKPFVVLKSAISLDGKIATKTGESRWISCTESRRAVHKLRSKVDAIIAGTGTILKDDPLLTARLGNKKVKQPIRVILDNQNSIPLTKNVFRNASSERVIYVTSDKTTSSREKRLSRMGVDVCILKEKNGKVNLPHLMKYLGNQEISSVLIEGGSELSASALKEGIVDKIMLFVAPIIIGGELSPSLIGGEGTRRLKDAWKIKNISVQQSGSDLMIEGYL
ncbi:MAG: bifunctional diaminohydroxyphosphoribosylaminopyrimidine deaminase/5-amino-6-(5-phosphoribosylamino)uracil reductase RibD [Nitrospinales bacterium]